MRSITANLRRRKNRLRDLLGSAADPVSAGRSTIAPGVVALCTRQAQRGHPALPTGVALLPEGKQALWAENACAELAILVEQESPKDGAAAWAECLRRFPDGVHAALARSRAHTNKGK